MNSAPWAAPEPLNPPPGPRSTNATATASEAPTIGPATYTLALKDISQLKPSAAGYVALWLGFTIVALLPLEAALVSLAVSRDWTVQRLQSARGWLERNARILAAAIILLLAAALLRNGIVALTS